MIISIFSKAEGKIFSWLIVSDYSGKTMKYYFIADC